MGLFDLLNPLLDWVDRGLGSVLGATGRLALWALLGAATSMFIYRRASRQKALAQLKPQIKAAQEALARFDGELRDIPPLLRRSLGLSLRQFGLALGPAVVASIPLLFLLAWLSNRYALIAPQAGELIEVVAVPAGAPLSWNNGASEPTGPSSWTVAWPGQGSSLKLSDSGGRMILELPTAGTSTVVHKHLFWNYLMGNPAGYLDDDAPLEVIELGLAQHEYLSFGPGWMRGWEFPFIALLVAFSLAIKLIFRIH